MPATLTLRRTGGFRIHPVPGTTHCGLAGKPEVAMSYTVTITCDVTRDEDGTHKSLDSRGFLLDQLNVHRFFQETYDRRPCRISCEVLCMEASERLWGVCKRDNPHCRILEYRVELAPIMDQRLIESMMISRASMEFSWKP